MLVLDSVNQMLPSGPVVIPLGAEVLEPNRELADHAGGRDPADLAGGGLGEPEVAIRAGGNPPGGRQGRGDRKRREAGAVCTHPRDLAGTRIGDPEIAVRADHDILGPGPLAERKRSDRGRAGHDLTECVVTILREPDGAVGRDRDALGKGPGREGVLLE